MAAPGKVILFLAVGLVAASQSGNIVRLGDAPPAAMAAWRLALATLFLAPLAGGELRRLKALSRRDRILLLAAGAVMAAHFYAWIAAVQHTTVANAAVFFSFNPVITAAAAYLLFKERVGLRLGASIGLGIGGVVVLGGGDLSLAPRYLAGDLLALASAALFTAYFLLGKRLRRTLPTAAYVTAVYGTATAASFGLLLVLGLPAVGYTPRTWLCFLLLALLPTVLGHTSFNHALRYIPAGRLAAATLSEPLLAGIVAWYAWDEAVSLQTGMGYALVAGSVLVLVFPSLRNAEARSGRPGG